MRQRFCRELHCDLLAEFAPIYDISTPVRQYVFFRRFEFEFAFLSYRLSLLAAFAGSGRTFALRKFVQSVSRRAEVKTG